MYVYEHKQVSRWMLYAVSLPFALAAGATFRRGMVLPALGLAACGGLVPKVPSHPPSAASEARARLPRATAVAIRGAEVIESKPRRTD